MWHIGRRGGYHPPGCATIDAGFRAGPRPAPTGVVVHCFVGAGVSTARILSTLPEPAWADDIRPTAMLYLGCRRAACRSRLPLMREVAFAEQMTEGERVGTLGISLPQPRSRSAAPSSEGAKDRWGHRALQGSAGACSRRVRLIRPGVRTGAPSPEGKVNDPPLWGGWPSEARSGEVKRAGARPARRIPTVYN